jgi:LmbE family N-acetylglucosaminyl deacetylase
MSPLYVLAHFDDEYGAFPLLLRDQREGRSPWLLYVADYASRELSQRRLAETRRFIASLGLDAQRVVHVGGGTGVLDGNVYEDLHVAHAALEETLLQIGDVERLVICAWEGGHQDHDACAALAVALSRRSGGVIPIDQFSLYNARKTPSPLFRATAPIPENGPLKRVAMTSSDWLRYGAAVRFFPSQTKTWLGLWPAMVSSFILNGGYRYQSLDPSRITQRPHSGPLLYERMFKTPYEAVRAHLDAFLTRL